jgi:hypothetical protein
MAPILDMSQDPVLTIESIIKTCLENQTQAYSTIPGYEKFLLRKDCTFEELINHPSTEVKKNFSVLPQIHALSSSLINREEFPNYLEHIAKNKFYGPFWLESKERFHFLQSGPDGTYGWWLILGRDRIDLYERVDVHKWKGLYRNVYLTLAKDSDYSGEEKRLIDKYNFQ